MRKIYLIIIVCLFFSFENNCAQEDGFFRLSDEVITSKYESKHKRVEKLFEKALRYMEKANRAKKKLSDFESRGSGNPMRRVALRERLYRLKLKAYSYVEDAHKIQFRWLSDLVEVRQDAVFASKESTLRKQFREGIVLRRKAETVVPGIDPADLLAEATDQEALALEGMEILLLGEEPDENQRDFEELAFDDKNEIVNDSLRLVEGSVEDTVTVGLSDIEKNQQIVKPEADVAVEDSQVSQPAEEAEEVFFSIQFMATRNNVSESQVSQVYNGSLEVIENRSDGWYRFSAGRFKTVEEASIMMNTENIHGFVVAFHDDERITIREAKALIKGRE